jgi:benzoyl-CoA reductase/2-hydroxyglutaryl-CoA dehydratase subunit BcrC/BadD/HgdB
MSPTVVYSSPFVPAEWIFAHGLTPCRIGPVARHRPLAPVARAMGVCSYAATVADHARQCEAAGVVLVATCDQMRRAFDQLADRCGKPAFLMHVPVTWQTATSRAIYRDELARLSAWLRSIGGREPSNLTQIMVNSDDARAELRRRRAAMDGRSYSEMLATFAAGGAVALPPCPGQGTRPPAAAARLALVGGPLEYDDLRLFDIVRQANADVVLDATETGERTWPARFDRRAVVDDPAAELASAYFGSIAEVFRRPNTHLFDYLHAEITQRQVGGVVLVRRVWCDLWHAELVRMKERLPVPVVEVDLESHDGGQWERASTRIQSLLEVLQ